MNDSEQVYVSQLKPVALPAENEQLTKLQNKLRLKEPDA